MSNALPDAVTVRPLVLTDIPAIRDLHARAFGPGRFVRTAYRIREKAGEISPFCRVASLAGRIVAAVKFTPVVVGHKDRALLLGPLAVDPAFANQGYGRGLVQRALDEAREAGIRTVLLVGDEPYYRRLGFQRVPYGKITLPGPVDPDRLLAVELVPGALHEYAGLVAGLSA